MEAGDSGENRKMPGNSIDSPDMVNGETENTTSLNSSIQHECPVAVKPNVDRAAKDVKAEKLGKIEQPTRQSTSVVDGNNNNEIAELPSTEEAKNDSTTPEGIVEVDQSCSLFVGDINKGVTEEQVSLLFEQYGTVVKVDIKKDRITGNNLGYGFVTMSTVEETIVCKQALHNAFVFDKHIRIGWAQQNTNLFIGDLGGIVDDELLRETFRKYGPIYENDTFVKHGNYGFVRFKNRTDAENAKREMNGQEIVQGSGKCVRIGWGDSNTQKHTVHFKFDLKFLPILTKEFVKDIFAKFGDVDTITLPSSHGPSSDEPAKDSNSEAVSSSPASPEPTSNGEASETVGNSQQKPAEAVAETDASPEHAARGGDAEWSDKRKPPSGKGFGFVHYYDTREGEESAATAIDKVNGKVFEHGIELICSFGKRKPHSQHLHPDGRSRSSPGTSAGLDPSQQMDALNLGRGAAQGAGRRLKPTGRPKPRQVAASGLGGKTSARRRPQTSAQDGRGRRDGNRNRRKGTQPFRYDQHKYPVPQHPAAMEFYSARMNTNPYMMSNMYHYPQNVQQQYPYLYGEWYYPQIRYMHHGNGALPMGGDQMRYAGAARGDKQVQGIPAHMYQHPYQISHPQFRANNANQSVQPNQGTDKAAVTEKQATPSSVNEKPQLS